ncbi:hypothetical protein L9F63_026287 [Diploptera punctata]|uniref:C2H2-type domain-containing protein n=1 Tax=Diploptera punctata TaxID=6984 RepID=A0AAD8AK18_DIPPU|nr:hypothetical protein L9F63_026287 [Diploptera punctata]
MNELGGLQESGNFRSDETLNNLSGSLSQGHNTTQQIQSNQQLNSKQISSYRFPGAFSCPRCRKVYRYKTNMLRHLKLECGKDPQFQCPYCPRQTKHKSSMQRHIENRHTPRLV